MISKVLLKADLGITKRYRSQLKALSKGFGNSEQRLMLGIFSVKFYMSPETAMHDVNMMRKY